MPWQEMDVLLGASGSDISVSLAVQAVGVVSEVVLAASRMAQGSPLGLPEEQIPRHKCSLPSEDCSSVVVVHLH